MHCSFALANADDPLSFECISSGATISRTGTVTITSASSSVVFGAVPQATTAVGAATYVAPPVPEQAFTWATYDASSGLLQLRNASGVIQCHYAKVRGSGGSRTLLITTLGGNDFEKDWRLQCDPAAYNGASLESPSCVTATTANGVASNSTLVRTFNFAGGGDPVTGGVASTVASVLATAAAAIGAAAAIFMT